MFVLMLVTASMNVAICEGWKPAQRARMACCAHGVDCPLRDHDTDHANGPIAQATADACCASSERQDSPPSSAYVLPAIVLSVLTFQTRDVVRPSPISWFSVESYPPDRSVPRHLFLAVFLI